VAKAVKLLSSINRTKSKHEGEQMATNRMLTGGAVIPTPDIGVGLLAPL
jgi:hypothetical protein